MPDSLKMQTRHALEIVIAFTPWVISMFVLYLLENGEIWTPETPHRDKISIAILVAGMGLSFLVRSHFTKRAKNRMGSE
jgi:hypothetical protein